MKKLLKKQRALNLTIAIATSLLWSLASIADSTLEQKAKAYFESKGPQREATKTVEELDTKEIADFIRKTRASQVRSFLQNGTISDQRGRQVRFRFGNELYHQFNRIRQSEQYYGDGRYIACYRYIVELLPQSESMGIMNADHGTKLRIRCAALKTHESQEISNNYSFAQKRTSYSIEKRIDKKWKTSHFFDYEIFIGDPEELKGCSTQKGLEEINTRIKKLRQENSLEEQRNNGFKSESKKLTPESIVNYCLWPKEYRNFVIDKEPKILSPDGTAAFNNEFERILKQIDSEKLISIYSLPQEEERTTNGLGGYQPYTSKSSPQKAGSAK